jgi:hypothetical protein
MKQLLLLSSIFLLCVSTQNCSNKKISSDKVYKGKLQVKALCMNYTLSVLEGDIDKSKVEANWTDESSGKSYANAFGLADPCSFPNTIKEGDEFYFTIPDSATKGNCAVCMAYYPTPPKKLYIKIVEK